jgi:hypothetical protein
MKMRLVVINPEHRGPDYPVMLGEGEDGNIWLRGDDWALPIEVSSLEAVTVEDVRNGMEIPAEMPVLISEDARPFPENAYWLSEEMIEWWAAWKQELVTDWHKSANKLTSAVAA